MTDWTQQRYWEDVHAGDALPSADFPLPIHRMIVQVGANKDFALIHHNREMAQRQGAPDMFANNVFLMGMWERVIREYIGLDGRIAKLGPFRIKTFTPAGDTAVVEGEVLRTLRDADGRHLVEMSLRTRISTGTSVEGVATAELPSRAHTATIES